MRIIDSGETVVLLRLLALFVSAGLSQALSANECSPEEQVSVATARFELPATEDYFPDTDGVAVHYNNGLAIVGADDQMSGTIVTGSATIFSLGIDGQWQKKAKLYPTEQSDFMRFGRTVAITDNAAIIAARNEVFIFDRGGDSSWTQAARFSNPNLSEEDSFTELGYGTSVDIAGDYAFVGDLYAPGAPNDSFSGGAVPAGAVHVYNRQSDGQWKYHAKLQSDTLDQRGDFGQSLDANLTTLVVGDGEYSGVQERAGAVFVCRLDTNGQWVLEHQIDGERYDGIGTAVALDCSQLAARGLDHVEVWRQSTNGSNSWSQDVQIPLEADYQFDHLLAISGDQVLVPDLFRGTNSKVRVFHREAVGNWIEQGALRPAIEDQFLGMSFSASQGIAVVGMYQNTSNTWSQTQLIATTDTFPVEQQSGEIPYDYNIESGYRERSRPIVMSIENNRAVLGYMWHQWPTEHGYDEGFAYVYENSETSGWQRVAELEPQNSHRGRFGLSVAISGDAIAVSANGLNGEIPHPGKIFMYSKGDGNDWQLQQVLYSGYEDWEDRFGVSIAMDGDLLAAVTTENYKPVGLLLFERNISGEWIRTQRLVTQVEPPEWSQQTNVRVAIDSGRVIVESVGTVSSFKQKNAWQWVPDFTLTGDDFSVDQNNLWAKRVGNDGEIQYLDTTIVAATTSVLSDTAGTPETTDTDATGQQSVDSDAIEGSGGGTVGLLSLMLFGIWLFGLRGNALRRVTI